MNEQWVGIKIKKETKDFLELNEKITQLITVAHIFKPGTQERQAHLCEFKISLVYKTRQRTANYYTEKTCLKKRKKMNIQHIQILKLMGHNEGVSKRSNS